MRLRRCRVTTPAQRLAQWKTVEMPIPPGLSAQERRMVDKLGDACRLLDEVFWRQSDTMPKELTEALAATKGIPVDIEPVFTR